MIRLCTIALVMALGIQSSLNADDKKNALDFKMKNIQGKEISLKKQYGGKVILFVNVASRCGATPQYEQLQKLHKKYAAKGLAVVGVPCNQFGAQEPGTNLEIQSFCKENYQVTFDMLAKVNVNGADACGLYQYLTGVETKPRGKGKVAWNFEKFIVDRNGKVIGRFGTNVEPDAEELVKVIEAALAKK